MPVTLQQSQLNTQDKIQSGIIDEFRKSSFLMDNLTFDNTIAPTGNGNTMTFGYTRLKTQPTADFRAVNTEYTPGEVQKERITGELKIFGGAFEIDRVIAQINALVDEVQLQASQKIKATNALFNDTVINGDSAVNSKAFDGLDKALTGSSTELIPGAAIDLSSADAIDSNYKAFLDILDEFLYGLDGTPTMLAGNAKMIAKLKAVARRATMYQTGKDNFGQQIDMYGSIPFVDLGAKAGSNDPVVAIDGTGLTSLYAVRFGLDGFHAYSLAGFAPCKLIMPDFSTAGAVKKGEVEMVAAVALKATKAAGVLRKIKVQ